jgi:FixJ family two-component response regulator
MENHIFSSRKLPLHLIEADTRVRCEIVKASALIGHHCEPYADLSEIAAHPPREGIIIARDDAEAGGIAMVLERLLALGIWLPVVALDVHPSPGKVVQAIKQGALDYLSLPLQPERLEGSIARISKEALEVSASRKRMIEARTRLLTLSNREMEVLDCLASGNSNKEIGRSLDISPRTVEIHRANMMTKLGTRHAVEVVRLKIDAMLGQPVLAA